MEYFKKINALHVFLLLAVFGYSCSHNPTSNTEDSDQIAYDAASAVVGSQLYNDFTKTPGFEGPSDSNVDLTHITGFKDFYRCKQCHAWDLKARYASYINRAPNVSRPDVSTVQLVNLGNSDISDLFKKIKNTGGAAVDPQRTSDGTKPSLGGNEHPDYGKILTDSQIWDLVKFLKDGAFNVDKLYKTKLTGSYPTGSITFSDWGLDGNASVGQTFYTNKCKTCHGVDGTSIDIAGYSIGKFVRNKPYEVQHKVVSGQLGTNMQPTPITLEEMKGLLKYASDSIAFPDLPQTN